MNRNNDIETELDGTDYCEVCEQTDVEGTRNVCVTEGEVEVCYQCLTEDASVKEIRQAAIDSRDVANEMAEARIEAALRAGDDQ